MHDKSSDSDSPAVAAKGGGAERPTHVRVLEAKSCCIVVGRVYAVLGWRDGNPIIHTTHEDQSVVLDDSRWEPAAAPEGGALPPLDDALRAMRERARAKWYDTSTDNLSWRTMADFAASEVAALKARVAEVERERADERRVAREAEAELAARAEDAYAKRDKAEARVREVEARMSRMGPIEGDLVAFTNPSLWAEMMPPVNGAIVARVLRRQGDCATLLRTDGGANAYPTSQLFNVSHLRFASAGESSPQTTTPLADLGALTKEDRAWMDAAQERDAHYDGTPTVRDAARAAVAARKGAGK